MLSTLRLMNDTIAAAILAAVSMALHRAMMFRGCLFETWHSVDLDAKLCCSSVLAVAF